MDVALTSLCRRAAFLLLLAVLAPAAEERSGADGYAVGVILVPGSQGAEICGKGGGQHVHFRVDFGADLLLSVNGAPGVGFDPGATYAVRIECGSVGGVWTAMTRVTNLAAGGVLVCEQRAYPIAGAPDRVHAAAAAVLLLEAG